ncbi:MAG: cation transporting ATPase C-terminal domain-containing protein, partial [Sulfuricurvum sp.]|uniref:cation-translocating P-type ATPase C-terminal domain-containing protein n=1 Tax=Sulfuricurvum sp. TaxID=2025608 RepID=UPI0025D4F232
RSAKKQFFDSAMFFRLGWFALVTASVTMTLFITLYEHNYPYESILSATFTTVVAAQWLTAILAQKESEPFLKNIRRSLTINPWLWGGISLGIILQTIALYLLPDWFHVFPPSGEILGYVAIALIAIFALDEGYKWMEYLKNKRKQLLP